LHGNQYPRLAAERLNVEELFMKLYNRLPKEMTQSLSTSALWCSSKQCEINGGPV
jgi:hypothetical protein